MPTCRHNFHLECIDVWLQKQTTCPICRISLRDQSSTKSTASPLRGLPQLLGHPESSAANRSPHWILPIHRDRTGARQNRPTSQESLEVIIEIQPQRHWGNWHTGWKSREIGEARTVAVEHQKVLPLQNPCSTCSSCGTVGWVQNESAFICLAWCLGILCTSRAVD